MKTSLLFSHGHTWTYMDQYFTSCPTGHEEISGYLEYLTAYVRADKSSM